MASNNDARALHDLLEIVGRAEQRPPRQAWEVTLDADWGSIEFTRRYAEVLHLYTGAMNQVASLPTERAAVLRSTHGNGGRRSLRRITLGPMP